MGLRLFLFHTPKHKVFNYQPVFYDEQKEDLKERIAKAEAERDGVSKEEYKPGSIIMTQMRKNASSHKMSEDKAWIRYARVLVISAVLVLISMLFLYINDFFYLI